MHVCVCVYVGGRDPSSRMSSPLAPPVNSEALLLRVNLFIGYHYKIPEIPQ